MTTSTTQTNIDLENKPIRKLFLKYTLPAVISMLFVGLQTIVDGIIVGNYIGSDALGAVNIITPYYSFLWVVFLTLGIGTQSLMGISMGKKEISKAQDAMTTGFIALIVFSVSITIVQFFFNKEIVHFLGADERLSSYALDYLRGLLPFIIAFGIYFYSEAMLKALGHPIFASILITCVIILNIILSLIFVIVLDMGIYGAGLGTGISFAAGAIAAGIILFNPRQELTYLRGKFRWKLLGNSAYNGSSEGVSELAAGFSIFIINLTLMKHLGADGVAAFTALNYINFASASIFIGIANGIIPIVSYNYGARKVDRIRKTLKMAIWVNFSLGVLIFITLSLFGKGAVELFFKDNNSVVVEIATNGMKIYAFTFLINWFNILATSFFTALGNAKNSIIIASLRGLVFLVTGVMVLPLIFDINGIWASIPFAELMTFIVALILIKNTSRKFNSLNTLN